MKINIYYGGRGMIDDPAIAVIGRITSVLDELRVNVERYDLHELKSGITALPQTINDADAIIIAGTIEWYGIGGYIPSFLDACWLYGDKAKISETYMFPIVMSKAYGEKEKHAELMNAWEILGGKSCTGIAAYVPETMDFDMNDDYRQVIEKKAEEIYRTVSQKYVMLPTSNKVIKQNMVRDTINLTPQETEQLSKYASNDDYVKKQKEDIEELAGMFKSMLEEEEKGADDYYLIELKNHYIPQSDFKATYLIKINDKNKSLIIEIDNGNMNCYFGQIEQADVISKLSTNILDDIVEGRMTFQRAFMQGVMTAKGNLRIIRMFDENFIFSK